MSETVIQPHRSPMRRLTGVRIVATGSYLPEIVVRNEDLANLGYDADWIIQRTGISERRHAPQEMATSDMAVRAARQCFEQSGRSPDEVDLVILGTYTPDLPIPASSCVVQDKLGISAPAFDLHAACAGFFYALVTGMQFVASGCSKLALIVGSDTNSRIANPDDVKTYPIFGDGAGAVLIEAGSPDQGLIAYTMGADGSGEEMLCRRMGGSRTPPSVEAMAKNFHFVEMDGRPIFKWAIRLIDSTVREVLAKVDMEIDDIDLLVLHQANSRIIDAAADSLGIPAEKVLINVDRYGNTSAGTIPITLDEAYRDGRIQPGSRLMLAGFGAGLAWGTGMLIW